MAAQVFHRGVEARGEARVDGRGEEGIGGVAAGGVGAGGWGVTGR